MTPPPLWNFSENSSVLEGEGVPKWPCSEPFPCAKQIIFPFYLKYINVHSENIVPGTATARRCTCEFYKQGRQTMLTLNSVSTKIFIISIHLSP